MGKHSCLIQDHLYRTSSEARLKTTRQDRTAPPKHLIMSDSAPLQRLLVWLRRHKEVRSSCNFDMACLTRRVQDPRSHPTGPLGTEQSGHDPSMDASIDKSEWRDSQNTPLDRSISSSTRRFSKISGRSWSTDKWSDDNASDLKRRSRNHRLSMFSSHNPDEDSKSLSPTISSSASRPPCYVPRHASSSHLLTTAPLSPYAQATKDRKANQSY